MTQNEQVLYSAHPAINRNDLRGFLVCLLLIPIGLGILLLFIRFLNSLNKTLIVTDRKTILRRGILAKRTSEVFHADVRHLVVNQTMMQRLLGVGDISISSSGEAGFEIDEKGFPSPQKVKEIIQSARLAGPSKPQTPAQRVVVSSPAPTSKLSPPKQPPPTDLAEGGESVYKAKAIELAQRSLDFLAYAASFTWVARLPDWAQPIVWGLLISLPIVVILTYLFNRSRG